MQGDTKKYIQLNYLHNFNLVTRLPNTQVNSVKLNAWPTICGLRQKYFFFGLFVEPSIALQNLRNGSYKAIIWGTKNKNKAKQTKGKGKPKERKAHLSGTTRVDWTSLPASMSMTMHL